MVRSSFPPCYWPFSPPVRIENQRLGAVVREFWRNMPPQGVKRFVCVISSWCVASMLTVGHFIPPDRANMDLGHLKLREVRSNCWFEPSHLCRPTYCKIHFFLMHVDAHCPKIGLQRAQMASWWPQTRKERFFASFPSRSPVPWERMTVISFLV